MSDTTDNVTRLPIRDLVAEMTGPAKIGNSVVIDGRMVPNLVIVDRGDIIEFILDNRLCFPVAREHAWQAAAFAFAAMAIGAGFGHPAHMHFTQRPFAPEVIRIGGTENVEP